MPTHHPAVVFYFFIPRNLKVVSRMSGVYAKGPVRFAYPENWVIEEESDTDAELAVTALSPHTAFWTVMVYDGLRDLPELVDAVASTLEAEYPQLEQEPAEIDARYPDPPGAYGYDLSFAYLDLMNSALLRAFHHQGKTYLVLAQAEDHDLEQAERVFRAMTMSLTAR